MKIDLNLCKIETDHKLINKHLHILYDKLFWMLDIKMGIYGKSQGIRKWLRFLPSDFTYITAIYQIPSGEVVLFIDNKIYV